MFTKLEDLPEKVRKRDSAIKFEKGWLTPSIPLSVAVSDGRPDDTMRNVALRARFLATTFEASPGRSCAQLEVRANASGNFQLAVDQGGLVSLRTYDQRTRTSTNVGSRSAVKPVQLQAEYVLELIAIGTHLQARLNGQLVGIAKDANPIRASLNLHSICPVRDIEVINLDGLPEAEALKILGVDEKGNDLRQKPAAAAAAVAVAAPAPSPPTPAAAKAAMTPASSSPSLPISKSSDPKFPPGQWVKVFTKAEDLPENLRKPDSGVKFEDGWIIPTNSPNFFVQPTSQLRGNYALRCRVRRNPAATTPTRISIRRKSASEYYGIAIDDGGELNCTRRTMSDYSKIAKVDVPSHSKAAAEYALEFGAIGPLLIARCDDSRPLLTRDSAYADGPSNITGNDAIRDIEVINLDGLSEAEALRIIGVDEKGNDLRALAAKQEQQKAEMAKAADAMAAIPELKTLHEQFVKLQAERVTAPFEAEVAKLNAGYVGGIDREIANEKKAGHLDGVIALEAEKKLIADKQPVPAEDDEKATEALKKLRGIYRAAYAKLEATRAENLKALTDPLSIRLKQLESTLTQQNRIDHAKTVREYRENLGKEGSADTPVRTSTNGGAAATMNEADKSARAPLADLKGSSWRKAAEWTLSLGGQIDILLNGRRSTITRIDDLPSGKFEIIKVDFLGAPMDKQLLVTDEGIALLGSQKEMELIKLVNASVTDQGLAVLEQFPNLDACILVSCRAVTDGVLDHLKKATKLRMINLSQTAVSPACLPRLKQYRMLEDLVLDGLAWPETGYEGVGELRSLKTFIARSADPLPAGILASMKKLPLLTAIMLMNNRNSLTDEDFADIGSFTQLTKLGLPSGLGDETLARVAKLPELQELTLSRGTVTDAGLAHLKSMKKLTTLIYDKANKITEDGLADLQKALPNLKIVTP